MTEQTSSFFAWAALQPPGVHRSLRAPAPCQEKQSLEERLRGDAEEVEEEPLRGGTRRLMPGSGESHAA